MGYIGVCGYIGMVFSMEINRTLILAILVVKRLWLLHSSLELGIFLEEATFSSLSLRPSTKALHKLCLG